MGMKEKTQLITKTAEQNPQVIQLNPKALTADEQNILIGLAGSSVALNAWEVYLSVHKAYLDIFTKPPMEKYAKEIFTERDIMPVTKEKLTELSRRMKMRGIQVPNYSKVVRILNDMVEIGWVQSRSKGLGRAKALYYLDDSITEQVKKFKK